VEHEACQIWGALCSAGFWPKFQQPGSPGLFPVAELLRKEQMPKFPPAEPVELLTPGEMAEADRLTIEAGTGSFELMLRAGAAVADAARRMVERGKMLVLAGPGNNGGDGFVAAQELRRGGCEVRVALLGPPDKLAGDAARAAMLWGGPVETLTAETGFDCDLIVDSLFGAGLTRQLVGVAAEVVQQANGSGRRILAVDLPSGIDGRTGEVRGAAIRAERTVTFFRLKPGHLLYPGREHCGATELVQIGIKDEVLSALAPKAFRNGPELWRFAVSPPGAMAHKYARGHVCVVSGPATATGAARLAAAGALRIGAGAVTVASPPDALLVNATHLTAIMLRRSDGPEDLAAFIAERRVNAAVVGPGNGVGAATRANVEALIAGGATLVLDADALTSFAGTSNSLFRAIAGRAAPVVMTPHEGEFSRLFGIEGAKIDRATEAARASGAVVILKGSDTVIAGPDGQLAINDNAPPDLATAGSGDVLAGMVAGLMAQGVPGFEAACAAVWLHGATGDRLGRGLIAEDLPGALPAVLQRVWPTE
jgi:hydroxyethylthiazole kinase-like uncharacterized protein yjeF